MTDVTSRRATRYCIIIFYLYFWHKDVLGLFWHNKALGSAKNNAWVKPATIANKNFMKNFPIYVNIQIQQHSTIFKRHEAMLNFVMALRSFSKLIPDMIY